jgi:hypothetical protein
MAQLSLACPHCGTNPVGFTPRGAYPTKPMISKTLLFLQCEACGHGIIAVFPSPSQVNAWMSNQVSDPGTILEVFPKMEECPADVPPLVSDAYISGLDNLGKKKGANAAAIMFRRTIEIATKIINPDAPKSDNLKKRINDLPANLATPAMKDWAHHIRLDANDAAHDPEQFSDDDAKQLHIFAKMFLTYAFTLPAMMKRAKGEPT